jgi:ArsR family transcriptional regulator
MGWRSFCTIRDWEQIPEGVGSPEQDWEIKELVEMGMPALQSTKPQDTNLRAMAELFKSLADETRLVILTMLLNGEMCVCEIMGALPISQPAVSHHLKILRQAGILIDRRQGKWIYYRVDPKSLTSLMELLSSSFVYPAWHGQDAKVDKPLPPLCEE